MFSLKSPSRSRQRRSSLLDNFEGAFSYDEDEDEMHPREFKSDFELSDQIIMVPKFKGSIVSGKGFDWPNSLFEQRSSTNRLAAVVQDIIVNAWNGGVDEYEDGQIVGHVSGVEVIRNVRVFEKVEIEDADSSSTD